MNQVVKRTISGLLVGAGVIALFLYCPLPAFMPIVLVLSGLVQLEFYQLARKYEPVVWPGMLAGTLWLAAVGALGFNFGLLGLACAFQLVLLFLLAATCVAVLFSSRRAAPLGSAAVTLLGFFYVPFLLSFFLLIVQFGANGNELLWERFAANAPAWPRSGLYTLLAVIAAAKFSDTGGFALGLAFGKHKMCPSVSPKKSWEGLAGSMVFAAVTMCVFLALARRFGWETDVPIWGAMSYPAAAVAGAVLAVAGTLGDLVESRFKREVGVKDSATFMPAGMGGFLDMFDSVLFLPALVYPLLLLGCAL